MKIRLHLVMVSIVSLLAGFGLSTRAAETVLEFDGSARVLIEESELLQQNFEAMSLEFWVKPDKIFNDYTMVMHRHDTGEDDIGGSQWWAGFDNNGNLTVTFNARAGGQGWDDGQTSAKPAAGEWHHVAGTWDGTTGHVYLNGNLIHSYNSSSMTDGENEGVLALGGTAFGGSTYRTYEGRLSDVRLWNVMRTEEQIQQAMNQRLTGSESGLIGYWPLDENDGDTVHDVTENLNHGDIDGAEWVTDADLTLAFAEADFLPALPFTLADIETGSTEFTNSNEIEIVDFPIPEDYDLFQITESGDIESLGAWTSTSAVPGDVPYTQPTADTNVTLYAWFTNSTEEVMLRRAPGDIFYTESLPVPEVRAALTIERLPGENVVIYPAHLDAGSGGGTADDREMDVYARWVLWVSGPGGSSDLSPDDPYVTVDAEGEYELRLWVQNEAGNTAISATTSTVSVVEYSGTNIWTGAGATDFWHDPANWTAGIPQAGQDVWIDAAPDGRLTAATAALGSFYLAAGRTLTVEGWDSMLEATELTIAGTMTHASQTATEPDPGTGKWVPDQRILLNGQNITLTVTGHLNADAKGYQGGYGPGAGEGGRGGGGYGGSGGQGYNEGILRGWAYGVADTPWQPGSGGGGVGGSGGGAIRIVASNRLNVEGKITAHGQGGSGTSRPGGSGGGIWITCRIIEGSAQGEIRAEGRNGTTLAADGGGGRIAIHYDMQDQAGHQPAIPPVRFSAKPGDRSFWQFAAEMGTLYLPDELFVSEQLDDQRFWHVHLVLGTLTEWTVQDLLLDHCIVRFPDGFDLVVEGDLTLRNGARLGMHAAPTNAISGEFGAQLDVGGDLQLETGSWLDVYADPTNAAVVGLLISGNTWIGNGSGIDASGRGYTHLHGPGRSTAGYGAGSYGGLGGRGASTTYGNDVFAVDPGSPGGTRTRGGGNISGLGGGAIRLMISGNLHLDGTLTADGMNGGYHGGGGGSGGSVFVACRRMTGTGTLRANGGMDQSNGGKGGGGRVAVWYRMPLSRVEQHLASRDKSGFTVHEQQPSSFAGTVEANSPQTGDYPGEHGTVRFCTLTGTLLMMR